MSRADAVKRSANLQPSLYGSAGAFRPTRVDKIYFLSVFLGWLHRNLLFY